MTGMRVAAVLAFLAVAASAAACGGGSGQTTAVNVTLKEWEVAASPDEAAAGRVSFRIKNEGAREHQLVVVKSDLPPAELPVTDGYVDEEKLNITAKIDPFPPGETRELKLQIAAGKYLLICNVSEPSPGARPESHYQNGMAAAFFVPQ
jgi:uncharacterized cupredoxin-like copper-binding protein